MSEMSASGTWLHLDLSFPPDWSRIDPTREAVGLLVLAMFGDDDLRDALAMVSEELLENAIKYCTPESTVSLSIRRLAGEVVISVTNSVAEGSPHVETLRKRIEWVRGFDSPGDAWAAALGRIYERRGAGDGDPGLGIVRIAFEGGCDLDVDRSRPGEITVNAHCARPVL